MKVFEHWQPVKPVKPRNINVLLIFPKLGGSGLARVWCKKWRKRLFYFVLLVLLVANVLKPLFYLVLLVLRKLWCWASQAPTIVSPKQVKPVKQSKIKVFEHWQPVKQIKLSKMNVLLIFPKLGGSGLARVWCKKWRKRLFYLVLLVLLVLGKLWWAPGLPSTIVSSKPVKSRFSNIGNQ